MGRWDSSGGLEKGVVEEMKNLKIPSACRGFLATVGSFGEHMCWSTNPGMADAGRTTFECKNGDRGDKGGAEG